MKYVALLRGVNVGGNRRVPKAEFQKVLEDLGFTDVVIYINSGNAVFSSESVPEVAEVQVVLEKHFGFTIPTLVLSGEKIQAIAAAIPADWTNDSPKPDKSGQKSDVLYLFDEVNAKTVLEDLGHKPEVETMIYVDGAVLANVTRKNQSRGSLQRIIGTSVYSKVTIRNITTAKKLAELARE
ncbi:MAG: DUF1697 domain-containing protein [Candidatus Saccharimonas sp.]